MNERKCKACGTLKPVGEGGAFAVKERTTNGVRWDSICLSCKRQLQAERRRNKKPNASTVVPTKKTEKIAKRRPDRIIEPKLDMTNKIVGDNNFQEFSPSRNLTYFEKQELVRGFNEFVGLLLEELSELRGEDVYLKKS